MNFWDKSNEFLYLQLQDNENPFLSLKLSILSLTLLMLIYSTAFSRAEIPPGFKSGILENLWEGVLLLPEWTDLLLHQQVRLFGKTPSGCIHSSFVEGKESSLAALAFPLSTHPHEHYRYMLQSSPGQTVSGQHCCPIIGTFPRRLPQSQLHSQAVHLLQYLLFLSCFHQQIIHREWCLPGFTAIQTFEQMMPNIEKTWLSLQCKCITPNHMQTPHSRSSHFLKPWIRAAHQSIGIRESTESDQNALLQSVSLIQQSFRIGQLTGLAARNLYKRKSNQLIYIPVSPATTLLVKLSQNIRCKITRHFQCRTSQIQRLRTVLPVARLTVQPPQILVLPI